MTETNAEKRRRWVAANKEKNIQQQRARRAINPEKHNAYAREWQRRRRDENPALFAANRRSRNLKKNYGLTVEAYTAILTSQGGRCAVSSCRTKTPGRTLTKHFSVDHCHATGKVRGLLCHRCNIILHAGRDTEAFFVGIIQYLERNR